MTTLSGSAKLCLFRYVPLSNHNTQNDKHYLQVTSPALTDSPKLERQVSELVAHINGEYGSLDFIPVHH